MYLFWPLSLTSLLFALSSAAAQEDFDMQRGERVYRYYCYQCHAYSGDAATLASAYLEPSPRDFTSASPERLDEETMTEAVNNGRDGTAMPSFKTVLTPIEIRDVVAYVRHAFMGNSPRKASYHTDENGWNSLEHYEGVTDFVSGAVRLESPPERLTSEQLRSRSIYLTACISCHEQGGGENDDVVWELRAVSYPRRHYSHQNGPIDLVSAASPYALHDRPTKPTNLSATALQGMGLFQENCAFCHAADGTGKNWIGSFLEPRPRDFTDSEFRKIGERDQLASTIRDGLAGRSMPAWRDVLSDEEIDIIIDYMQEAFAQSPARNE